MRGASSDVDLSFGAFLGGYLDSDGDRVRGRR